MSEIDLTIDHRLPATDETIHSTWNNALEPVLTIEPGDVVQFECRDATNGQIDQKSTATDVPAIDISQIHPLTGPVAIAGAKPGDVLTVDILSLEHHGWGYTLVLPGAAGLGLLADDFPEPAMYVWDLEDGVAHFTNGIEVPVAPFPGTIGVAPADDGEHETTPPRAVGGNLDIKHLTAGSTLHLPIAVEDALFSIGDCHAAQGDGEVCVNGLEAPMTVTCRFELQTDRSLEYPQFETTGPLSSSGREEPVFGTTGVDADLHEATKIAIRGMIEYLHHERGLARDEAYILCSVAVDLKVNQVVNAPNWTVSAYLPERIFPTANGE
ncbi:acetamidase/formamidase family protein [Natronolimnobius sp. AArcel1]|uniref:acetamidase/formamidase family protein n=1 Tax=Natronolimnobius sp. AArcel1 TaxID=1679093 RepID=UPI0013ED085C|nr:acetamidase/formamidase family protein [Natronolimnobius sp. AArcel1]NGM69279.1 acetamidase/formamidase family protein [Natronolimnobius sp. AArcel1]